MSPSRLLPFVALALLASLLPHPVDAVEDAPPVDIAQILQALGALKDQQVAHERGLRQRAIAEVNAAAANPARAVQIWEDAVRAVQFDGSAREGTQFREWKDREGKALADTRVQNAARLYFGWLALTLQRAGGTPAKDLLPSVIAYTKEVAAAKAAMDSLDEAIKREKELAGSGKHGARDRDKSGEMAAVKQMHDNILAKPVGGSVVVQWMKIGDLIAEIAPARRKAEPGGEQPRTWEQTPGNIDGIFQQVVLPELRAQRDPRVLEYWDLKLKTESETIARSKLSFEIDKFNQIRRPQLLWGRAQDILALGQRNRAASEMFAVIKSNPTHPDAEAWIAALEQSLAPPAALATSPIPGAVTPASPEAPAPILPGAPAAPGVAVPPAK